MDRDFFGEKEGGDNIFVLDEIFEILCGKLEIF